MHVWLLLSLHGEASAQDAPAAEVIPEVPVDEPAPWHKQPIDPSYETDFTAFTVPHKAVRLGVMAVDYGLTDDFQIGTSHLALVYGYYNVRAKANLLTLGPLDVGVAANPGVLDAGRFGKLDAAIVSVPITSTFTWRIAKPFSLHTGFRWQLLDVRGTFAFDDLASSLAQFIGVQLPKDIKNSLEGVGGLYGGANLTLAQLRVGFDVRFNRRDSLIVQYRQYTALRGRFDLGYENEAQDLFAGAAVAVREPLAKEVDPSVTLSYQMSYEKFALRVGIPLSTPKALTQDYTPLFWVDQAFAIYWFL